MTAGLLAPVAVIPAATAAAPAPQTPQNKASFAVMVSFGDRLTAPSGNADGVGDLVVVRGTAKDTSGNKAGVLTAVERVLAPTNKDSEVRDASWVLALKNGQVFAQGINEDPKGGLPETVHTMAVVGGTGDYVGARGTVSVIKMGNSYRLGYDFLFDKKLTTTKTTFVPPTTVRAVDDSAPQGISGVTEKYARNDDSTSYLSIATQVGSVKSVATNLIELTVTLADGTLSVRGLVSGKDKAPAYAVLGGTGKYAGYRGVMTMNGNAMSLSLAAPTGKQAKPRSWYEIDDKTYTVAVTGGQISSGVGQMWPKAVKGDKKTSLGSYTGYVISYAPVGGVTPVLGMIGQNFTKIGTMIVFGVTTDSSSAVRPVVGGTYGCVGASGSATSQQVQAKIWHKTATYWQ